MNQKFDMDDLRREWERLPTPDLEAMLHAELEKQTPDDDAVLQILHILEARERDLPLQLTQREKKAFESYRHRVGNRNKKFPHWLSVAASVALILMLLVAVVPQQAKAETFWEMLASWSDKILEFFSPGERANPPEYEFRTDHPGLQQVHDAVVEMGVTGPAVPMWIPEGYELKELEIDETRTRRSTTATFWKEEDKLVVDITLYSSTVQHKYYKSDSDPEIIEINGQKHWIVRNADRWSVVWNRENIECFITLDCREDELHRILKSIYVMEENE